MKCLPGPVIRTILLFGGGTRGLDCNYGWTMKVQLRFWNVSFLTYFTGRNACAETPISIGYIQPTSIFPIY